ncbi:MAG TPA: carbon monoxide dehydrogenase, partial [Variovorax sp.]
TATIEAGETPATSVLAGQAEVVVNGKFAQFGGRLMVQVSDMLLGQFVDNFRVAAAALPAPVAAAAPVAGAATPTAAVEPAPAPAASEPAQAKEINALAIVWHLVKSWFAGLFGKRA